MTTIVVTVAGSDPCGGAGIQADLKTFAALGAAALAVGLGRGLDLRAAVAAAKDYLTGALAAAGFAQQHARGPVHHAYRRCTP